MNAPTFIHCEGDYRRAETRLRDLENRLEEITYERDYWKKEAGHLVEGDRVDSVQICFGLTPPEAMVCAALYHRRDKLLPAASLEGLLDEERGYSLESNIISVMIGRIREKLGPDSIDTVRGRGYRLSQSMLATFDRKLSGAK